MEKEPRSAFNFKGTVSHSIPMNQTDYDELNGLAKFMNEEKATYQNALKNRAQALVDGHKSNGDWYPEKEQAIMKIAKAVGFDEELHKFIEEENRGYDLRYSEDAAPKIRQLTGDCRIRIRKEKPKLTGDTKIRVKK
jgi:pantothenate kinase-related protein Tda10